MDGQQHMLELEEGTNPGGNAAKSTGSGGGGGGGTSGGAGGNGGPGIAIFKYEILLPNT